MFATQMNSNQNDQNLTINSRNSSIGPSSWQIAKDQSSKPVKENEEWPSLGTSVKKEKVDRVRERHSTGNSIDDKLSKLKWVKVPFDITYSSKDKPTKSGITHDYDKENNSENNRPKKSRAYIKHPRLGSNQDRNEYRVTRKAHDFKGNHSIGDHASRIIPNAQIISRVPVGFPYLMLYPAVTKKPSTNSASTSKQGEKEVPSVPPACICILPPGTDPKQACIYLIRQQVQRQIEFYFTPENLSHDIYLRSNMDKEGGWVPVSLIAKFNRVVTLTQSLEEVTEAIAQSQLIELDSTKTKVRTRVEPEFWILEDQLDAKIDKNAAVIILDHLVVLSPIDRNKAFTSKETSIITTALNKYTNDVHIKAQGKMSELNASYLQSLASPSSVAIPPVQPTKGAERKRSEKKEASNSYNPFATPSAATLASSVYHQQMAMSDNPFYTSPVNNLQSAFNQHEWLYANYMIGNQFHVPTVTGYSNNQQASLQTNPNSLHAIPVIYMNSDGSISYFDENSVYTPDYSTEFSSSATATSIFEPPSSQVAAQIPLKAQPDNSITPNEQQPQENGDDPQDSSNSKVKSESTKFNIPFFQLIKKISSASRLHFLSSFNPPNDPKKNIRDIPISLGPVSHHGFLFSSTPNLADNDDSQQVNLLSSSVNTLKSCAIGELFKRNNIKTISYREFEKKCKDSNVESEIYDLFDFWAFFLTLNPLREMILNFRLLINDDNYSSYDLTHYRLILLRIYRSMPHEDTHDLIRIILTDARAYFERVGGHLLDSFNALANTEEMTQSTLIEILNLSIEPNKSKVTTHGAQPQS